MVTNRAMEVYRERIEANSDALDKDIKRWLTQISASASQNQLLKHHIEQFDTYYQCASDMLLKSHSMADLTESSSDAEWDVEEFRALVIGVFTNKWGLLRELASQRLDGHPYKDELEELDAKAAGYYHRLRSVLPSQELRQEMVSFAPLVHCGRLAELTIFNAKSPIVISVPFGAMYDSRSQLAIAHEVGHAFLVQVPQIKDEIKQGLRQTWAQDGASKSRRSKVFEDLVCKWLDEILADIVGTVLAEEEFVRSAVWIMATSESSVGTADESHPPTDVRPYIHIQTLRYLQGHGLAKGFFERSKKIEAFESSEDDHITKADTLRCDVVDPINGARLQRRFKSVPALTVISLAEVRQFLEEAVDLILKLPLCSLNEQSLGEILVDAAHHKHDNTTTDLLDKNELTNWGMLDNSNPSDFVLDLFVSSPPDFAIPSTRSYRWCEHFKWLEGWCK